MLVVNMEAFTADYIHHRASVQVIEFFGVRHDEESRPERVSDCFTFREWDCDHCEWAKNILENAKPFPDLRSSNRYRHDSWLLKPRRWFAWEAKFARKDEMPRLKNPWRQIFFPFPFRPALPIC